MSNLPSNERAGACHDPSDHIKYLVLCNAFTELHMTFAFHSTLYSYGIFLAKFSLNSTSSETCPSRKTRAACTLFCSRGPLTESFMSAWRGGAANRTDTRRLRCKGVHVQGGDPFIFVLFIYL